MLFFVLFWLFVCLSVHWAANYSGAANVSYVPGFIITTALFILYYAIFKKLATTSMDTTIFMLIFLALVGGYLYACYKALRVPIEGLGYFISSFLLFFVLSIFLAFLISRPFID